MTRRHAELLADLHSALGGDVVDAREQAILRVIRDNSWLSPMLMRQLQERQAVEGRALGVDAVVRPASEEQVLRTAEVAVRHQVPITPRGAGTSNFGLVTPDRGGLILDLRGLRGACRVEDGSVAGAAGMLQGELDRAARARGQELSVVTTTYASATAGGWVAGGHVGLGSGVYGAVWDGSVLRASVVTMTDPPQRLALEGSRIEPLLHTFGTMGILTELAFRTVQARQWLEGVAFFKSFALASEFVRLLSHDPAYRHRVATAQEEALMPAFRPLAELAMGGAGVLLIIDRSQQAKVAALAERLGGRFHPWQLAGQTARTSIAAMVYGHRMLWVKKLLPRAAFLHVYFDPEDPSRQPDLLKDRFGDGVLLETKFIRSAWMRQALGHPPEGTLPAAVITITRGDQPATVNEVMEFCKEAGIQYQNPHTSVLEDNGLFNHQLPALLRFKRRVDPGNLLNPGKLRSADTQPHNR